MKQQNYELGQIFEPTGKEIIFSEKVTSQDLMKMIEDNIDFDGYVIDVVDHPFIKYLIKTK